MPNVHHVVVGTVADLAGVTAAHATTMGNLVTGDGIGRQYVYNPTGRVADGITADGIELVNGDKADDYWESLTQDAGGAGGLGWVNVRDHGATGDGVDDTAAVAAANTAAAGGTLYFPAGTYLTDSVTFGATVTLQMDRGAVIKVAAGETVTLHTAPQAGNYQIFDADDSVTGDVDYDDTATGALANPLWWGAVADGAGDQSGTDNLIQFQQSYGSLPTTGYGVKTGSAGELFIPPGNYHLSDVWEIGSSRTINAYGVMIDNTLRINGVGPLNLSGIKVVDAPGSGIVIDQAILAHLRDIQIDSSGGHGMQIGWDLSGSARTYIDGLIINGSALDGLHIETGTAGEVGDYANALNFSSIDIKGSYRHGINITSESTSYGTSDITFTSALIESNLQSAIYMSAGTRCAQWLGGYLIGPISLNGRAGSYILGSYVNTATKTVTYETGTGRQPIQGERLTGDSSGATGRIYKITVDSGTWAGGDAAGTIRYSYDSGDLLNPESVLLRGFADWIASKRYAVGTAVSNDTGKLYVCTTAGKSAASGGPTGTGSGIADGTVVWDYEVPQTFDTTSLAVDENGLNEATGAGFATFWDTSAVRPLTYTAGKELRTTNALDVSGLGDTTGTTDHMLTFGGKDVFPIDTPSKYTWMIDFKVGGGSGTFYPERAYLLQASVIMDVQPDTVQYGLSYAAVSEVQSTLHAVSMLQEIWYETGDDGANNNGTPVAEDTVTGATSGATGTIHAITVDSGTWAGADAVGKITLREITGTFRSGESVTVDGDTQLFDLSSFGYKLGNDQGGATPAIGEKVKQATLTYDTGNGTEPILGETITSDVSGATATLASVTVDSGTWAGGTAVGTLTFSVLSNTTFVNADVLTFSGSAQTCNATEDGPVGTITSITTEGGAWVDGDGSGIITMDTLTGVFAVNPTLIFSGSQQTAYLLITSVPTAEVVVRFDTDNAIFASRNASSWTIGVGK